jgi:hypothetical protein
MKILEKEQTGKVSRKNFIFYSGIIFAGVYMLIKFPFKTFGKKEQEVRTVNNSKDVQFEANPESVRRG